jgi:hypothetical protein
LEAGALSNENTGSNGTGMQAESHVQVSRFRTERSLELACDFAHLVSAIESELSHNPRMIWLRVGETRDGNVRVADRFNL